MTIQNIIDKINSFDDLVINSGFLRDVTGHKTSITQQTQNLTLLKDVSEEISEEFQAINDSDLPGYLYAILLDEKNQPFTNTDWSENLNEILKDPEIDVATFYQNLNAHLTQLESQIVQNRKYLHGLRDTLSPFYQEYTYELDEENRVIISVDFKQDNTINSLKNFSRAISKWNRTLLLYHQLLKSDSPKDIELVNIENGSVDLILNLDLEVATSLIDLFKTALEVFGSYLAYKTTVKEIVKCYGGNKKLIDSEKGRDKLMMGNVQKVIRAEVSKQHKEAKKKDKSINNTSIKIKIDQVTILIKEHAIKGNDIRMLLEENKEIENADDKLAIKNKEYRKISNRVRQSLKELPQKEVTKLIEQFIPKEEENDE